MTGKHYQFHFTLLKGNILHRNIISSLIMPVILKVKLNFFMNLMHYCSDKAVSYFKSKDKNTSLTGASPYLHKSHT